MTAEQPVFKIPAFPVTSSNIHAIGYDDEKHILAIEFKSGDVFHYADVDADLAIALVHAPSIGRFYSQNIRGKFNGQKMTGPCPNCGVKGRVGETCADCGTAKHVDTGGAHGGADSDRPSSEPVHESDGDDESARAGGDGQRSSGGPARGRQGAAADGARAQRADADARQPRGARKDSRR